MEELNNLYGQFAYIVLHYEVQNAPPQEYVYLALYIVLHLGGFTFLYFGSLLQLSTVITFEASMLGPRKGRGIGKRKWERKETGRREKWRVRNWRKKY